MKRFFALALAVALILVAVMTTAAATYEPATTTTAPHVCPITKANENYHRVECDECDESYRVYHDEENMTLNSKNAFFHEYSCNCGYSYTAEHDFDTAFNSNVHYDVCVDCGYRSADTTHEMVNYFDGNYHYLECEYCCYTAEQHIGVKYEAVDSDNCAATCSDCGSTETVEHDWDGFICENCNFRLVGLIKAIVGSIREREDGYRVRFENGENYHYITLTEVNFEEGDFVVIETYGNIIWNITVMLEYDVCDNPENLPIYAAESVLNTMEYINYDTNTVVDIDYKDDGTAIIELADTSILFVPESVIVYDFVNGEIVNTDFICEDERIVWFYVGEQFVIIDYYY